MISECESTEMTEPRELKMQPLNYLLHKNPPHPPQLHQRQIPWQTEEEKEIPEYGKEHRPHTGQ